MLKSGSTRLVSQIFSSAARHVTVTFLNFVSPPLRANFLPPRQSLKGGLQSQLLRFSFWRGRKYDRYIAVIHRRYSSAFWRRVQSLRPARGAESRVYGSPGGPGLESTLGPRVDSLDSATGRCFLLLHTSHARHHDITLVSSAHYTVQVINTRLTRRMVDNPACR